MVEGEFLTIAAAPLSTRRKPTMSDWKPIKAAPKTVKGGHAIELLGWCPDETARLGGDVRVIWWEPMLKGGIWYSDRDLAEHPTHWLKLPEPPK